MEHPTVEAHALVEKRTSRSAIMEYDEDCAALGDHSLYHIVHKCDPLRIEGIVWFVEQQDGGDLQHQSAERHASLHAGGELPYSTVGICEQVDPLQHFVDATFRDPKHLRCESEILSRGQVFVQTRGVREHPDEMASSRGVLDHVVAEQGHRTRRWAEERGRHPQKGAFPRAVMPLNSDRLPWRDS